MNVKVYCISIFLVLFSLNVFSQNKCDVKFANGSTMKGIIYLPLTGPDAKKKIKIYDEKKKNPKKFKIQEIDEITVIPSERELKYIKKLINESSELTDEEKKMALFMKYKVIYSPKKKIPRLCTPVYVGQNFDFYHYDNTKSFNKFSHGQIFITKANSNIIVYNYATTNKKNNLKKLTKYFEGCNEFTKESKKKKAHKKKLPKYFYELTDKCTDFKS